MFTNPETLKVADIIKECFEEIALCEQNLHEICRKEPPVAPLSHGSENKGAPPTDQESPDHLLDALMAAHSLIDAEIDKIFVPDDFLTEIPGMSAEQLCAAIVEFAAKYPSELDDHPSIAERLAPLIVRAQILDAWLEPTRNLDMELNASQEDIRDIFDLDGHLTLGDGSILLRRRRLSWRAEVEGTEHLGLLARHLRVVAFIPSSLNCDDPDALTELGKPISTDYQLWSSPVLQANPVPPDPKIAVAPLAERGGDITFVPSKCRNYYAIQLNYDETRFAEALARALDQQVHILLVPEMALPEGDPDDFGERMRQIFIDVQADYFDRTAKVSELRLVVAGVLGLSKTGGRHHNYAAVFDSDGDQPDKFRQQKLSHWNITSGEQHRFGITHYQSKGGLLSDPIKENSQPADCLSVLEIPGIGRTAILICADMSQNNPGDWLSLNAVLDWLYAPIMDKSICWQISDQMTTPRPWIVRRAFRSARLIRTFVITTNSMALSRWVNEANLREKSAWPPYTEVGIGLAIDGSRDTPAHSHLLIPIDDRRVLSSFAQPVGNWPIFPSEP